MYKTFKLFDFIVTAHILFSSKGSYYHRTVKYLIQKLRVGPWDDIIIMYVNLLGSIFRAVRKTYCVCSVSYYYSRIFGIGFSQNCWNDFYHFSQTVLVLPGLVTISVLGDDIIEYGRQGSPKLRSKTVMRKLLELETPTIKKNNNIIQNIKVDDVIKYGRQWRHCVFLTVC